MTHSLAVAVSLPALCKAASPPAHAAALGAAKAALREAADVLGGALFVRRAFALASERMAPPPSAPRAPLAPPHLEEAMPPSPRARTSSEIASVASALASLDASAAADAPRLACWALHGGDLSADDMRSLLASMFRAFGLFWSLRVSPLDFAAFTSAVQASYRLNPFHSFAHCFTVTHVAWALVSKGGLLERGFLTKLDVFSLLLAAVLHDVDHRATTNAFEGA